MGWKSQLSLDIRDVSFARIYLREVGNSMNSKLSTRGYSHGPLHKHPLTALANKLMLQVNTAKCFFKSSVS